MNDISLTILPETPDDATAIERLHERTFGPGRYAKTAYRLREQVAHTLDLSFTARIGTLLVGSVWLSPIRIGETKALLLGPLTVEPAFRERGVGQALIERALKEAGAKGHRSSSWSATSRITAKAASSACRPAARSCLGRSIRRGFSSPNSPTAPSRAFPDRSGRTSEKSSASFARPGAGETAEQQQTDRAGRRRSAARRCRAPRWRRAFSGRSSRRPCRCRRSAPRRCAAR